MFRTCQIHIKGLFEKVYQHDITNPLKHVITYISVNTSVHSSADKCADDDGFELRNEPLFQVAKLLFPYKG